VNEGRKVGGRGEVKREGKDGGGEYDEGGKVNVEK
jgi:hypothetical protein